jgi:amino acid adenylation domain-containing protein
MSYTNHSNLVDLLRCRAETHPHRVAFTFLRKGSEESSLTYEELDREARAIASLLQAEASSGERALLLYPSGREFIPAFLGCLYAGVVAVPTYPPDPVRPDRSTLRLQAISRDAEPSIILTTSQFLNIPKALREQYVAPESANLLITTKLIDSVAQGWQPPRIASETVALLQYTSGSTTSPRGVMVTHGNLLHNERLIQCACEHDDQSTFVTWLPLYHDMGLIGTVLQPLYIGARSVIMPPLDFLQNPLLWLKAITTYRAVTTGGPNFGFDLCVRKIDPRLVESLDLSSWKVAFNGAEPIRHDTITRFSTAFGPCGFRPEAFFDCYGLAEATLIVSGSPGAVAPSVFVADSAELEQNRVKKAEVNTHSRMLVSSGTPLADMKVAVACPDLLTRRGPGEVGEIWIAGPSVALGYWGRAEETQQTFGAYLADTGEGPFLRTGDLGFINNGELFITGRLKDLIIIRGRNHYPQDIEQTVERVSPALRAGCGAAFAVETAGSEGLAIVQEVEDNATADTQMLFRAIIKGISEAHNLQVDHIVLVKPHSVPKTSSGKIQRRSCRQSFLDGALKVVAAWQASSLTSDGLCEAGSPEYIESWLASRLATRLGLGADQVNTADPISSYGLDSLSAIELSHNLETDLGIVLEMNNFIGDLSIADIALAAFDRLPARHADKQGAPLFISPSADKDKRQHRLSSGQRALWFLHQLAPESAAYNVSAAARIGPHTNLQSLHHAMRALINRHASLRTTFAAVQGQPVQAVRDEIESFFRVEHIEEFDDESVEKRLAEEASLPFDLEHGPLVRATVFRRSSEDLLLLSFHHIIIDFWSLCIFVAELARLYEAELTATPANLPPLNIRYTDFADWQAQMVDSPEGERHRSYWLAQLEGADVELSLPTDRLRPPVQTLRGASIRFRLTREQTENLTQLGRSQNATLYMVLLASLNTLLYRYTGQEDFLVGSMTSGRTRRETLGLIGYFVNPVVLRARVAASSGFDSFLDSVRRTVLDAYSHQDYPFASIVEQLQPYRGPSHTPLFQTVFVMQKPPSGYQESIADFALGQQGTQLEIGPLSLESISLKNETSQFDLALTMAQADGALVGTWQFSTDLFDHETVLRMSSHFVTLLNSIAANPHQSIASLPLLTEQERRAVLGENQARLPYPHSLRLHEYFEAHADQSPNKVAVTFEAERLTYEQVNMRANQLARYLIRHGVTQGAPVGIFMERSVELIIALIAVLKAGGTYVPIDPAHPKERVALLLKDADPGVIIMQEELAEQLPDHRATVVNMARQRGEITRESTRNLVVESDLSVAAYIIYTSGSTGLPKGVVVTHQNVVRLFESTESLFGFHGQDVWTMFHSHAFDFSVWEIWGALIYGGKLVVVPPVVSRSPESFHQLLVDEKVTVLNQTPSAFFQLDRFDESSQRGGALNLRVIIFGGEALEMQKLSGWIKRHGDRNPMLVNMYGITETTVHVTYRRVTKTDLAGRPKSVIGVPLSDLGMYILDEQHQPVPTGVIGEIHVAGSGLAQGYLNQPELTAERFIPNLYSSVYGDRLYKSGDLGRYLADGQVEYLGRKDQQVKIRGYRIELGEIEAALRQHAAVTDAAIIAVSNKSGETSLVAYVALSREVSTGELQDHLKDRLPGYMIPASFVMLERLPLTSNGKLDRKALPAPDSARPDLLVSYRAPETELELTIARVWQEMLGLDKVGVHDNFFDLGANSLMVVQVSSLLKDEIGREISVVDLFKYPSIRMLAEHLNRKPDQEPAPRQRDFGVEERRDSMRERAAARKGYAKGTSS